MSTGTKAKAWRGTWDHVVVHPGLRRKNCTVIPDSAHIPLPADVRRVLRHIDAIEAALNCDDAHHFSDCKPNPDQRCPACEALKAVRAYAEKRRKAGGR